MFEASSIAIASRSWLNGKGVNIYFAAVVFLDVEDILLHSPIRVVNQDGWGQSIS